MDREYKLYQRNLFTSNKFVKGSGWKLGWDDDLNKIYSQLL